MFDRELEMGSEWQLFGGQLQDVSAQSTFADEQGQVLQNSWHDDAFGELLYQKSDVDFLEDSAWRYSADVIDSKQPSSLRKQEGPSDDDLYGLLSSSPEEAFLPVDDDDATAVGNIASTVDNSVSAIVSSYDRSLGLVEEKFDFGNRIESGRQYLTSNIHQYLSGNQKVQFEISHDLVEVDKPRGTNSFGFEQGDVGDSLHYGNHYKPATELDGIECDYDSLLDAESVCMILKQLIDCPSHHQSGRPDLLTVSPEEVESVLSGETSRRTPIEDCDFGRVPSSPQISDSSFLSVSQISPLSIAVLSTEYSQDSLSPTPSSVSYSQASSPCAPYSVETRVDRRSKKKEQNKTAALRYRNKKREQKGVVYSEVEELEQKNAGLQARADDLTREINYLKGLLDEIKKQ